MTIEKQVCNKELSMRLRELGVPQKSIWEWKHVMGKSYLRMTRDVRNELWDRKCFEHLCEPAVCYETYSAFTVSELGEMLKDYDYGFPMWVESCWHIDIDDCFMTAETEADARAKLLVHLLENQLISLVGEEGK